MREELKMLIVKCQNTFIRVARSHYILQTSNSTHAGILSFGGFFLLLFFKSPSSIQNCSFFFLNDFFFLFEINESSLLGRFRILYY